MAAEKTAVVIPVYRLPLTPIEEISLAHLRHYLGAYSRWAVAPRGVTPQWDGFRLLQFDPQYFTSISTYSHLLLSPEFYQAFDQYEFILIYQLDCLVFSDQLEKFCDIQVDYLGAPWFKSPYDPGKGFSRVGNGGFSLRRVASFLKVLSSKRYQEGPISLAAELARVRLGDLNHLPWHQRIWKRLAVLRQVRRGVQWYTQHYSLNEDHFWSDRACIFDHDFRVARVETGLKFSFERFPRYCFEQNGRQLPFGCHAWNRWDQEFWQEHLLSLPIEHAN